MATKRWYLMPTLDANGWAGLSETAQTAATLNQGGWVVGTGATLHAEFSAGTAGDRQVTAFVGTTVPDGTLDTTLKDAFRTPILNGTFASANWTFQFAVVGTVQSGAADGRVRLRLLKADADGSNATEITSAQQLASIVTNVTTTDLNSTLTFNPGAITLTNQYLFIQLAWERTGAGGMTTTNVRFRTGSSTTVGTTILSSDFTPSNQAVTTQPIASGAVVNSTGLFTCFANNVVGLVANFGGLMIGQSISGHSGPLTYVSFWLDKGGTITDTIYLELRQATWTGTLLGTSASVDGSEISLTAGWVTFTFSSPPELSAGTTYYIKFFKTTAAPVRIYHLVGDSQYLGGTGTDSSGTSNGYDWAFQLGLPARALIVTPVVEVRGVGVLDRQLSTDSLSIIVAHTTDTLGFKGCGQTVLGMGQRPTRAAFWLARASGGGGTAVVSIYATTGGPGELYPIGSPLVSAPPIAVSTLPIGSNSFQRIDVSFPGDAPVLVSGVWYCLAVVKETEATGAAGDSFYVQSCAESHLGNLAVYTNDPGGPGWGSAGGLELRFELLGVSSTLYAPSVLIDGDQVAAAETIASRATLSPPVVTLTWTIIVPFLDNAIVASTKANEEFLFITTLGPGTVTFPSSDSGAHDITVWSGGSAGGGTNGVTSPSRGGGGCGGSSAHVRYIGWYDGYGPLAPGPYPYFVGKGGDGSTGNGGAGEASWFGGPEDLPGNVAGLATPGGKAHQNGAAGAEHPTYGWTWKDEGEAGGDGSNGGTGTTGGAGGGAASVWSSGNSASGNSRGFANGPYGAPGTDELGGSRGVVGSGAAGLTVAGNGVAGGFAAGGSGGYTTDGTAKSGGAGGQGAIHIARNVGYLWYVELHGTTPSNGEEPDAGVSQEFVLPRATVVPAIQVVLSKCADATGNLVVELSKTIDGPSFFSTTVPWNTIPQQLSWVRIPINLALAAGSYFLRLTTDVWIGGWAQFGLAWGVDDRVPTTLRATYAEVNANVMRWDKVVLANNSAFLIQVEGQQVYAPAVSRDVLLVVAGGLGSTAVTFPPSLRDVTVRAATVATLVDEHAPAQAWSGYERMTGQSFIGDGSTLVEMSFWPYRSNATVVGTVYAELFLATGTHGVNALPTGSALATSEVLDVALFPPFNATVKEVRFGFSAANQVVLQAGVTYVAVYHGGTGIGSTTGELGHAGNFAAHNGASWDVQPFNDLRFAVRSRQTRLFTPIITQDTTKAVGTVLISGGTVLRAPTVQPSQLVTTAMLGVWAQAFAPTVNQGPVSFAITTTFIGSLLSTYAPTLVPGPVTVTAATVAATSLVRAPTVFRTITGPTLPLIDWCIATGDSGYVADVNEAFSQSFLGTGVAAAACQFDLYRTLSGTTGLVEARIYASAGTHGTSAIPTGAALATSAAVDSATLPVSSLPGTGAAAVFVFPTPPVLAAATTYCVALHHTTGSGTVGIATNNGNPHAGNRARFISGTWTAFTGADLLFQVVAAPTTRLFAPTVAIAQVVSGQTLASTAQTNPPTVVPDQGGTLPTIASTGVVYGPVPQKVLDLHGFTADATVLFANQAGNGFSQSVTGLAGPVDRVGYQLLYITGAVPGGEVFVRLRSGSPFGTILGDSLPIRADSLPVQADGVAPVAPTYFSFPSHPVLVSGTTYVFQIVRTVSGINDAIGVRANSANPYAGGTANSASGTPQAAYDLFIDVWIFGGVTLLAPVNEVYATFIAVRSTAYRPATVFNFSQTPLAIPSPTIIDRLIAGKFSNGGLTTTTPQWGQSFLGDGRTLGELSFWLSKAFTPTGNARAHVYATTGTHGVDAVPVGSPLATSTTLLNVTTLTTGFTESTFQFTNGPLLAVGVTYMAVLEGPNNLAFDRDLNMGHGGNSASLSSGTWTAAGLGPTTTDMHFIARANLPAPSVDLQDKSITTAFIAPTTALFTPTIKPTQFVGGAFIEPNLSDYSWLTQFPDDEAPSSDAIAGLTWSVYIGQEFTVGSVEALSAIDLRVDRRGNPADSIYVEIRAGGRDGTVVGTSVSIAGNTAPLGPGQPTAFVTLSFATAVVLTPGTLYAWVAKRTGAGSWVDYVSIAEGQRSAEHGLVDPVHTALLWDLTLDPIGWFIYANYSFEYRLRYAVGVFAPTVAHAVIGAQAVTTAFVPPTTGAAVDNVLLEDGSGVLLEDGSGVLLEATPGLLYPPTVSVTLAITTAFIGVRFSDAFPWSDGVLPTVSGGLYATTPAFGNVVVASHLAQSAGTGEHDTYLTSYAGSTVAQWSAITIASHQNFIGPSVFHAFASPWFYLLELVGPTDWRITRVLSGNFTYIAFFTVADTAPGTVARLEVALNASGSPVLTAYRNGVFVGTFTDNDALKITSGVPSFRMWNPGTTGQVSKFEAGDLTARTFTPTVSLAAAQAITGATIGGVSGLFAPTVATGAVAVTGATRLSTTQLFAPSVTTGPVTVGGTTQASTSQLFVPALAVGSVTVAGATRASTSAVTAPSVAQVAIGATIPSASGVFPPSVAQTVTTAHRATTIQLFTPTVGLPIALVTTATVGVGAQSFVPSVAAGAVTITGATRLTTAQVFVATISVGPVTVNGATVLTTVVLQPATITAGGITITAGTVTGAPQAFAPSLAVGPVAITGATRATTLQVFAPVLTAVALGATIVSGSGTFVPTLAGAVTTATLSATSQVFVPVVAGAGVVNVLAETVAVGSVLFLPSIATGLVTVSGATLTSTAQSFAPTVAVAVGGATRASASLLFAPIVTALITTSAISSTAQLFAPTVLPIGALGGPTTGSTLQLFAPSVATGPVAVVGGTRASTLQVFTPTVGVGAVSVTGATRSSTAVLFPPEFIARLDGTFIGSTTALFPPTVKITQFVTTALIPTGVAPFAASVLALWAVTGGTRLSTTQTFAPSVTTGAITITGGTVLATSQLFAPALVPGAVTVTTPQRTSTLLPFAPSVASVVETAHRATTVALFPPALATGAVTVGAGTILSVGQVFPPSLGAGLTTAPIASTVLPFAPTLAPQVTTPAWVISTELFPPSALPLGEMIGPHQPSTAQVFPPFMVAHGPPSEYHDFISNIVREAVGTVVVCREQDGTVILTRTAEVVASVDRGIEMSSRILADRVFSVDVER